VGALQRLRAPHSKTRARGESGEELVLGLDGFEEGIELSVGGGVDGDTGGGLSGGGGDSWSFFGEKGELLHDCSSDAGLLPPASPTCETQELVLADCFLVVLAFAVRAGLASRRVAVPLVVALSSATIAATPHKPFELLHGASIGAAGGVDLHCVGVSSWWGAGAEGSGPATRGSGHVRFKGHRLADQPIQRGGAASLVEGAQGNEVTRLFVESLAETCHQVRR
jgi:hypothetical protein